jgi:Ca2+/Na+ antiporter
MNAGMIGGIVGPVVGVMGGLIGTYFSIKNTKSPRERRFVIRASIICWLFVILFLTAYIYATFSIRLGMWAIDAVVLVLGINYWNRKQRAIRQEEESSSASPRVS